MTARWRTLALPLVICLTALATASSGIAVAAHRHDNSSSDMAAARDARSAAAEDSASAAYRAGLQPVAEAVFDQVQSLSDAQARLDEEGSGSAPAYYDAVTDPRVGKALAAAHTRLRRLNRPARRRNAAARLDRQLALFEDVARIYRQALRPKGEEPDTVKFEAAATPLGTTIRNWDDTMHQLWGSAAGLPPLPVGFDDPRKPERAAVSAAAYLLSIGRACTANAARFAGLSTSSKTTQELATSSRARATALRRVVGELRAVKAPPQDRTELGREIVAPLVRLLDSARDLDGIAAAVDARDGARVQELARRVVATKPTFAALGAAFEKYGSRSCAADFSPV